MCKDRKFKLVRIKISPSRTPYPPSKRPYICPCICGALQPKKNAKKTPPLGIFRRLSPFFGHILVLFINKVQRTSSGYLMRSTGPIGWQRTVDSSHSSQCIAARACTLGTGGQVLSRCIFDSLGGFLTFQLAFVVYALQGNVPPIQQHRSLLLKHFIRRYRTT